MNKDCVWVETGSSTVVPIFPQDEVERAGDVLKYGALELRVGDAVTLTGSDAVTEVEGANIPMGCPDTGYWITAPGGGSP